MSVKRAIAIHPPLFAAFPVLSLYSANLGLVPLQDIWHPLMLTLAVSIGLWLLGAALFRSWHRGAAAATALIIALFSYSRFVDSAAFDAVQQWQTCLWAGLALLLLLLLVWRFKRGDWQTTALNVLGVALMLSSTGSVAFGLMAAKRRISEVARHGEATGTAAGASLPDIFYIILDGYGREDQLKRVFGYDDSAFTKGLESRGFYVAKASHSNFVQTELSLASSLNIDLIQNLLPKISPDDDDRSPLDELIIDNGVARHLKAKGYQTVAITTGFPSFRMIKADVWYHAPLKTSLFEAAVLQLTPVALNNRLSGSMFSQRRLDVIGALDNLANLANRSASPRFVFVHILVPHPPFVFAADGSAQRFERFFGYWDGSHYYQFGGTRDEYARGYTGQVTFLNSRILPLLDLIQKQGNPRPIILIQGDHGSKMNLNQDIVEKTDLNECFSNLSAFYVPDSLRAKLYPSITPVNSFRLMFNQLFGENLALLPDKSWYSSIGNPYKMIEVTDKLLKTPAP